MLLVIVWQAIDYESNRAPADTFVPVTLSGITVISEADCAAVDIIQLLFPGRLTCLSRNSLICASEASRSFLLLDLAAPRTAC